MTADDVLSAARALPNGSLTEILEGGTPIILAPHQDDEVIGCGGLLAAATHAGIAPAIVFVTDGSGSHPNSRAYPRDALIALRQREARGAAHVLGIEPERLHFMRIRDTEAPHDGPALVAAVDRIVSTIVTYPKPVIFAPWDHDPHGDHQAVHKMAVHVARALTARHLSYLVWGWTLPANQEMGGLKIAGWRFRVDDTRSQKSLALDAYKSQVADLIDDDPAGFRLDRDTLRAMLSGDEVYLLNS
jgi:LmbE family N-acetylglucosaminyl deacetylase